MQVMWVQSPGWEDPPGVRNGNPLQYSCWRVPWTVEPARWARIYRLSQEIWLFSAWESISYIYEFLLVQSVQLLCCVRLCNPMDCSTPGFPVHHQLLELAQTHVHRVGDAIQPSHPLSSPSSPAFNLSQHQGLFEWVSSLHQVTKLLEFQLQC